MHEKWKESTEGFSLRGCPAPTGAEQRPSTPVCTVCPSTCLLFLLFSKALLSLSASGKQKGSDQLCLIVLAPWAKLSSWSMPLVKSLCPQRKTSIKFCSSLHKVGGKTKFTPQATDKKYTTLLRSYFESIAYFCAQMCAHWFTLWRKQHAHPGYLSGLK